MLKRKFIKTITASLLLSNIFLSFSSLNAYTAHASTLSSKVDATLINANDIITDNGVWKAETFYDGEKYTHALPYRVFVPDDYNPNEQYSLVLFLHGAGERGTNNIDHLTLQPKGPNLFASAETQSKYPTIIVAPQCPPNEQWVDTPWVNGSYNLDTVPVSDEMQMVVDIIDNVKSEYNIDENKMYSTGISMGGYGAWNINLLYPDMFAAMIPICGASDPSKASLIKDKGVWAFHGDADTAVPVSGSRDMISALKSINSSTVYTEYSGVAHNSWDRAYSTPGLVDWLYSHSKDNTTVKENLSLNKITTSSGSSSSLISNNSVDGDKSDKKSRWSSNVSNDAWMQVDLGKSKYIDEVRIFWDEAYGTKYKILLSEDGINYNEIFNEENGTNGFDLIKFKPTKARYVKFQGVQSAKSNGYSFLEFEIYNRVRTITKIKDIEDIFTKVGVKPTLPEIVGVQYSDNTEGKVNVQWDDIEESKYNEAGTFTVYGDIEGYDSRVSVNVIVEKEPITIINIKSISDIFAKVGVKPALPKTVEVQYSDNTEGKVNVQWDDIEEGKYNEAGTFTVYGHIEGYDSRVSVNIIVENNKDKDNDGEDNSSNGNNDGDKDNDNGSIGNDNNESNNSKGSLPNTGDENLGVVSLALLLLISGSLLLKGRKRYN